MNPTGASLRLPLVGRVCPSAPLECPAGSRRAGGPRPQQLRLPDELDSSVARSP